MTRFIANILSAAGITDKTIKKSKTNNKIVEVLDFLKNWKIENLLKIEN